MKFSIYKSAENFVCFILVFYGIPYQFYARYQTVINKKICFDVEAFLEFSKR